MPITELQRQRRKTKIGSSDVAAILNMDPFRSAADVWASKTFDVVEREPSLAMELGNYLERGILNLAAKKHNVTIRVGGPTRVSKLDPLFAANPDALVQGQPLGMEAKVVGPRSTTRSDWSEADGHHEDELDFSELDIWTGEGAGSIPDHVQLQVQHQMYVVELECVLVPAYLAGELRIYRVERNDELIAAQVSALRAWWGKHIVGGVCPEGMFPDVDIMKRIRRVPKSVALVPRTVAEDFLDSCDSFRSAEKHKENCKGALLCRMNDAEGADWGDEESVFTFLEQSRSGFDLEGLRRSHPDIAEKYATKTTNRVLRKAKRSKFNDYRNK